MEHNDLHFGLNLTLRMPRTEIKERDIIVKIKHGSQKGKEATEVENESHSPEEDWIANKKLVNVRLCDTIKIEFVAKKGQKTEDKASVYIPHQDLYDCCKKSEHPFEKTYALLSDNINEESHLGHVIVTLESFNPVGALPILLYDPVFLIPDERLRLKISNNTFSKEWVSLKNDKGEKLMWAKWHGVFLDIMHHKQNIGHVTIKEKFVPGVLYHRAFTFFYHGERICRAKFQKMNANGLIEFYNGDLPVALQGDVHQTAGEVYTREVTATRDNEVIARFNFDKRKKIFIAFFNVTFTPDKIDFPLLAFMATILGSQKIA